MKLNQSMFILQAQLKLHIFPTFQKSYRIDTQLYSAISLTRPIEYLYITSHCKLHHINHQSSQILLHHNIQHQLAQSFKEMFKSFLTSVKYFMISSSVASAFVYSVCWYKSSQNEKDYLKAINGDTLKDASRLSNESFGISWGFQADDTVMNSIDSGDLFFVKYECKECLNVNDMLKCYWLTLPLLDEQYHALGVAYRDDSGLYSYWNQLGDNRLMRYSQFVSLPYVKELMVQKTSQNIHQKLLKLLEEDKAFDQVNPAQQSTQLNKTISHGLSFSEPTFKFINRVLKKISLIEQGEQILDIRELLTNEKQVNIRTQTNKVLRSL